ncbi:peptidoglycan-binding protein [Devosia rhodophyticola]|uniref:Peptidoglycan-binding protein n=1 Tax=Devosia rhodophyticola TaxID=3026423 RepID=A0ABY7YZP8_9HYPH|nr:peptidoglycan-binding protein [Devosia rhodophyticola]WDR06490.1 peptidoglycan-binding protein [Devosia rhodophyticola]
MQRIQQQLSDIGFDAGPADGVMGAKTRQAIASFQHSIGAVATGELSGTQTDLLLAQQRGPSEVPVSAVPVSENFGFSMLNGIDLPYNDFRSGMSDRSLRDIGTRGCLAACAADRQCRAFTYNVSAGVCFLKTNGVNQTAFPGAVSGVRGPTSAFEPSSVDLSRPLSREEIARLQAGLNARGYEVGRPDGVIGTNTRNAIARFIADNPTVGAVGATSALLQAVLQSPNAERAEQTPFEPNSYQRFEDVESELALISINRFPEILDKRSLLLRWFQREYPSRTEQERIDFDSANVIRQDAILEDLRMRIIQEAEAFTADPNHLPIRLRIWRPLQINGFNEQEGIAIGAGANSNLSLLSLPSAEIQRTLVGAALDAPDIKSIPITNADKASAFLDLARGPNGNGQVELVGWYTITEVAGGQKSGQAYFSDNAPIQMTVSLDRVSVATMRSGPNRANGGDELFVLYEPQTRAPAVGAFDNIALAQQMGIPIAQGHVLLPADQNVNYEIEAAFGTQNVNEAITRYLSLAAIHLVPEAAGDRVTDTDIWNLMSRAQRARVYGALATHANSFANEFERRRATQVLNEEIIPEWMAEAPSLPVPVVTVFRIQLGEYDFAAKAFPISSVRNRPLFYLPSVLASSLVYENLPTSLAMDEDIAERFATENETYGRPWVWVATFGELSISGVEANGRGVYGRVSFAPSHSGIFADPQLTEKLAEIDPAQTVVDPSTDVVAPEEVQREPGILAKITPATELELLGHAYAKLLPRDQAEIMVESSNSVRTANEFEQADARTAAMNLLASMPGENEVWLVGSVDLGTYDLSTGKFATSKFGLTPAAGDSGFHASFKFTLADTRGLDTIGVDEENARKIVKMNRRRLPLVARVNILDVTVDPNGTTPNYNFSVEVAEIVLWGRLEGDDSPPTVVANFEVSSAKTATADVPPLKYLDPEALDYLLINYAPQMATPAQFGRMMAARWLLEKSKMTSDGVNFFPPGTDLLAPGIREHWLPEFTRWASARAQTLHGRLTIVLGNCASSIASQYWRSPISAPMISAYPQLGSSTELQTIAAKYLEAHASGPLAFEIEGYLLDGDQCNTTLSGGASAQLGWLDNTRSGAVVLMDSILLPGKETKIYLANAEIDIEIETVEIVPVSGAKLPAMAIKAKFAGLRAANGAGQIASFTAGDLAAARASEAAVTPLPEGWDIVGLRPGMTLAAAEAVVRSHMDVAAVYKRKPGVRTTHFLNERAFVSSDLTEAIDLVYLPGADGDTVHVISRKVAQKAGTMAGTLLEALRAKYGEEREADQHSDGFRANWVLQPTPRSNMEGRYCRAAEPGSWEGWELEEGDVDGIDQAVTDYLQVRGQVWLPGPRDIVADALEFGRLDCGVSIDASKHVSGNSDVLLVQITDFEGYARAFEADQKLAGQETEAPKLDFAL